MPYFKEEDVITNGREVSGRTFAELTRNVNPDEILVGEYRHRKIGFTAYAHIIDADEFSCFNMQVSSGALDRKKFFAVKNHIHPQG